MPIPATTEVPNATQSQHSNIAIRSSLSLLGAFLQITRSRFSSYTTESMPWRWDDTVDTDISIELAYNPNDELRGLKPTVRIGKGPTMWGSVVIGDRAGVGYRNSIETKMMHGQTQIIAQIVSRNQGELFILADVISSLYRASSDAIRKAFQLRDVRDIVEGTPTPYPQSEDHWQLPVSVTLEFTERWLQQDAADRISELNVWLPTGEEDPAWYRHLALSSMS